MQDIEDLELDLVSKSKPLTELICSAEQLEQAVHEFIAEDIKTISELNKFINKQRKNLHAIITAAHILYNYRLMVQAGKIKRQKKYEKLLRTKSIRGSSGVLVITVLTSPYPKTGEKVERFSCKFDCHFCPSEPGQPKSYLKNEPAVARANRNEFDAFKQFRDRGLALFVQGQIVDKIELLILGGTWSSYPHDYKEEFVRDLYYAANTFYDKEFRERLSLEEEIKLNESTKCRIIGLTIETRPDCITPDELMRYRRMGVTRVQLGIQHTDNEILKKINRKCKTEDAIRAIKLLKDACFKVDGHLMMDLPGSSPEKDLDMLKYVISSPDLQLDQIKIYPCAVTPWTKIKEWYDAGTYKPYAEQKKVIKFEDREFKSSTLIEMLLTATPMIPEWVRVNRIIRDIPTEYIKGGYREINMGQIIFDEIKRRGQKCHCIRCREVRNKTVDYSAAKTIVRKYSASGGIEYFISIEIQLNSPTEQDILLGFLRLRISSEACCDTFPELKDTALIRELHVYGQVTPVDMDLCDAPQHKGYGKQLIAKAEEIAKENGYKRIAVISGVGVRNYYRKLGFEDAPNYLIKELTSERCIIS